MRFVESSRARPPLRDRDDWWLELFLPMNRHTREGESGQRQSKGNQEPDIASTTVRRDSIEAYHREPHKVNVPASFFGTIDEFPVNKLDNSARSMHQLAP